MDDNTLLRILIVIGLVILIVPLLMMSVMWLMMGGMMGTMGTSSLFGILPLLLALGIGYGGYRLLKRDSESDDAVSESDTDPLERLQEQYTKGEITEAEFEQKLEQQLDDSSPSEPSGEPSVGTTRERNSEPER